MATSTSQDLLRRLSRNISVQPSKQELPSTKTSVESLKPASSSISSSKLKKLPAGISIISSKLDVPSTKTSLESIKTSSSTTSNSRLHNLPAGISFASVPQKQKNKAKVNESKGPTNSNKMSNANSPLSKLSGVSMLSISKTSSTPMSTDSSLQSLPANQPTILDDISFQTLNQPLDPNAFFPEAFKCFPKSRSQIANTKNTRKYPQFSNESMKRRASTFMAAPSQEILAQMRQEGFVKDFRIESCSSSSEYLHCLLGYGLHQTLNFPIMGVFYLELVRLIMKHMDRFNSDEKVKLIQVRNVCEDILYQNSTRDDFLPIEIMDEIVEKAIKEENNAQEMEFREDLELSDIEEDIEEQTLPLDETLLKEGSKNPDSAAKVANSINWKLNMFSKLSVNLASKSKIEDTLIRNAKRKISEENKNSETRTLPGTTAVKNLPGISISSATKTLPGLTISSSSSKIKSSSNSEIEDLEQKLQEIDNQIASGRQGLSEDSKSSNKNTEDEVTDLFSDSDSEDEDEQTEDETLDSPLKNKDNTELDSDFDDEDEPTDEQIKLISHEELLSDDLGNSYPPSPIKKSKVDSGLSPKVDNLINDIRNMLDKEDEDLEIDDQYCEACSSFYNNKEEHNCLRKMKKQKISEISKFDFSKELKDLDSDSESDDGDADGVVNVEQSSRKLYNWSDF